MMLSQGVQNHVDSMSSAAFPYQQSLSEIRNSARAPMTESRCEFTVSFGRVFTVIRSGFESKRRESP